MSAVYHQDAWDAVYNESFEAVTAYVVANPGKDLAEIATACGVAYEVAYAICQAAGFVILPNASGELHWHTK